MTIPASNRLPEIEIPNPSPLPDAEALQQMLAAAAASWRRHEVALASPKSNIPADQSNKLQRLLN